MKKYYVFGSGISAIMTALYAQKIGLRVTLVSKDSDPRQKIFDAFGASLGGGPTRMMSRMEGDVYIGDENVGTPVYPNMSYQFSTKVSKGGWLDDRGYDPSEQSWLHARAVFGTHREFVNQNRRFYRRMNAQGNMLWGQLILEMPELFQHTFLSDQLIRSYDTAARYQFSRDVHRSLNALVKEFSDEDEISKHHPYLRAAFGSANIAGIFQIPGYAFNMQAFIKNALDYLERRGAEFCFSTTLKALHMQDASTISHFELEREGKHRVVRPDYASFHLGAYDTERILDQTPAKNTVMGVDGLWMQMEKPQGMTCSMKAHFGAHEGLPLTDLNLIENGDHFIVGGGYIFTGKTPGDISEPSREVTYQAMTSGLRKLFPDRDFKDLKRLESRTCSRSFTYDDVPRLDVLKIKDRGKAVIYAGDNTGTTSIAPCSALMVLSKMGLRGKLHGSDILKIIEAHTELRDLSDQILDDGGCAQELRS